MRALTQAYKIKSHRDEEGSRYPIVRASLVSISICGSYYIPHLCVVAVLVRVLQLPGEFMT